VCDSVSRFLGFVGVAHAMVTYVPNNSVGLKLRLSYMKQALKKEYRFVL
jgi:hypothetical protein